VAPTSNEQEEVGTQVLAGARKQTRVLARRLADRLPDPAQRGVRTGWRRLRPYLKRAFYSKAASPLVSIVIPVYNVERYLPECLDSVLSQSYPHLQVIVVDDGSPDRSIDIVRDYAARDRRVQIVQQPNAGLGAARNTGARHARGSYLMFIDSDDVLRPDAIGSYVRTLRRTGSDFVVGAYERMNAYQTWPAAWWIRSTHRFSRLGTNLIESPDVCVNAVAWSKFYRRKFWEDNGFAFPEGVLYEDQALSARAYAKAAKFDILAKVTYGWRVREDRSSITQQAGAIKDLRARLAAAENSLAELDAPGLEHVRNVRLGQYLSNDFPLSIKTAQRADTEFWEVLTQGLQRLTAGAGRDVWDRVSAQHRVAIQLVTGGHRDEAIDFVGLGHNNPKNIPVLVKDGNVYLDTPARHALGLDADDPTLALADHQLGLVSSMRRLYWDAAHRIHIEGWAYLDNVDLAQCDTEIKITAVERETGFEIDLDLRLEPSAEVTASSKHRYADYEKSCFHAIFDVPAALAAFDERDPDHGTDRDRSDWQLQATVSSGGISRTALLVGLEQGGSPGRLTADFLPDGRHVEMSYAGKTGLVLAARRPPCVLQGVRLNGRELTVSVIGSDNFVPHDLELVGNGSKQSLKAALSRGADGLAHGTITIPAPGVAAKTGLPLPGETWTVRVIGGDGTRSPAAWPDEITHPELKLANPRPERTQFGNLGVIDEPAGVRIDEAAVTDEGLVVSGTVIGGLPADLTLRLHTPKAHTETTATETESGHFIATVPLQADPWGLGSLPLPIGDYSLDASLAGLEAPVPVRLTDEVISRLPILFTADRLRGRLRLRRPNQLTVRLEIPFSDDERGSRQQQRLQDELRSRVDDPHHEPGAVLLRSYYGEICGCNPRALHDYLHDHPDLAGGPLRLYWAVKDFSVQVPEGGIPVLHESAEWYRLLHDAQYYMDNMHQPLCHKKPAHQVQIQTFHGYPFKQMGQSHWAMQGRDVAHVRSYLDRAADWDFLVSPASYGTDALCREFGFPDTPDNTVLEIGYPRNDVLFSAAADKIAAEVRDRLGIRPGQTAVLYGPTFRDSLSSNDHTAAMIDFLDLDRLATELGDDYVIMVRGHAFNARLGNRVGSRGTIIDVTDYPNIADLCLASDAAILDYSSLRFDYALTGKPMIFHVPDLEEYQTEARGSLWDYEPTAPGPLLSTTDEVIATLRDLDTVRTSYTEAYATFRRDFLDLDDGHATERLVKALGLTAPRIET
jgi:CDP-glycerol glycerophosphotransferase